MNLELQIYETAMRTTLRLWGAARSRDAIHDAVAEAYTRHLSCARKTGKVRRELGSFVAKSAGEVLRGRRHRGAHEQASDWQHGAGDNWLDPTSWLEGQGSGSEDALIELLDAEPPAVLPTPEEGAVALAKLLAGGWRAVRIAEEIEVADRTVCLWKQGRGISPSSAARLVALAVLPTPEEGAVALAKLLAGGWRAVRIAEEIEVADRTVCLWKQGRGISPSSAARLVALVGQSPPRRQRKPMGPRQFPGGELDPDVIERTSASSNRSCSARWTRPRRT